MHGGGAWEDGNEKSAVLGCDDLWGSAESCRARRATALIDGNNVGGGDSFSGTVKLNPNLKYVTPRSRKWEANLIEGAENNF